MVFASRSARVIRRVADTPPVRVVPPRNPHVAPEHGIVTLRLDSKKLEAQYRRYAESGGKSEFLPRFEIDVPVRTERDLKRWHPGQLVHIEFGDVSDLPGFFAHVNVPNWGDLSYPDPDPNIPDARREKLHLVIPLYNGTPLAEVRRTHEEMYRDGFFSMMMSGNTKHTAEQKRFFDLGRSDMENFHGYGSSFPGVGPLGPLHTGEAAAYKMWVSGQLWAIAHDTLVRLEREGKGWKSAQERRRRKPLSHNFKACNAFALKYTPIVADRILRKGEDPGREEIRRLIEAEILKYPYDSWYR